MHRITRGLNKRVVQQVPSSYDDLEVFEECFKGLVHEALTSALLEEQED